MSFKINWKFHIKAYLLAAFIFIILYREINLSMQNFIYFIVISLNMNIIAMILFLLVAFILMCLVHEIVHGVMYIVMGGKIKIGCKLIYMYTCEVSQKQFTRIQFLLIIMSPVVILSLLSLILPVWLGSLIYVLNLLGSTGDICMGICLCRYNYRNSFIDREYGFDIVS